MREAETLELLDEDIGNTSKNQKHPQGLFWIGPEKHRKQKGKDDK